MIYVQMAASELNFDLHYSGSGEYFILIDHPKRIVNLFDDTELDRTLAIDWMHKVRAREQRRQQKYEHNQRKEDH